jgi:hypothetical protein
MDTGQMITHEIESPDEREIPPVEIVCPLTVLQASKGVHSRQARGDCGEFVASVTSASYSTV